MQVKVPSSKSITQRAHIAAYFAGPGATVINPSLSDDANCVKIAMQQFQNTKGCINIDCMGSAFVLRTLGLVAAKLERTTILDGDSSLRNRPVSILSSALDRLGVEYSLNGSGLPITIKGKLKSAEIKLNASLSSQVLSGILMCMPLCDGDTTLIV